MTKRNINSRIEKVEMILEQDFKDAISKLNIWIESNPENQQEAFWRAVYDEFEWDGEDKDLLTGGLEYQPEDLEVAVSLLERAPQDLLKTINAFTTRVIPESEITSVGNYERPSQTNRSSN